jgi:CHAT domain-containing protein
VEALAELFGASHAEVHVGSAASETAVKSSADLTKTRFLHFASHGVIDTLNPSYSHIVLAPDPAAGQDGLLHVFEIFDLRLNADLVVLSACETALGKEVRGEGLIGLTRSFLYAGAPRVVVSLWPVSDNSTPALMVHLYSHLLDGFDTLRALQLAKLELLKEGTYRHPRYWAPFIAVGAL